MADGVRGLVVGDKVTSLNGCRVENIKDWSNCIGKEISQPHAAFCISSSQLAQQDISLSGSQSCYCKLQIINRFAFSDEMFRFRKK